MKSDSPGGLSRASARDHVVQPYTDDAFLVGVVGDYVREGWQAARAASSSPRRRTWRRLPPVSPVIGSMPRRRSTGANSSILDAERTLADFLVDGVPDRERFVAVIGTAFDRVHSGLGGGG